MAVAASNIYMKGLPVDSDKEWYHGELTREQAEKILRNNGSDCFIIRESKEGSLVLSLVNHGEIQHHKITNPLGWYSIDGWSKKFKELSELVEYISTHKYIPTTSCEIFVGEICKKRMTRNKGQYNHSYNNYLGVTFTNNRRRIPQGHYKRIFSRRACRPHEVPLVSWQHD